MKQDDRQLIRSKVMQSIDMSGDIGDEQVSDMIDRCILESESGNVLSVRDKLALKKELFNSLRRLDILSELLDDEAVTEIMINGCSNIFVERAGRMYRYDKAFESEERLKTIIQSIVAECNRIVNEASPIVDARLKDGSRVNVVLPERQRDDHKKVSEGQDDHGQAGGDRISHHGGCRFPEESGRGGLQHNHLGRNRRGQDDISECPVRVYTGG